MTDSFNFECFVFFVVKKKITTNFTKVYHEGHEENKEEKI